MKGCNLQCKKERSSEIKVSCNLELSFTQSEQTLTQDWILQEEREKKNEINSGSPFLKRRLSHWFTTQRLLVNNPCFELPYKEIEWRVRCPAFQRLRCEAKLNHCIDEFGSFSWPVFENCWGRVYNFSFNFRSLLRGSEWG